MAWPQPQPEAMEAALGWLRAQDPGTSRSRLIDELRRAGYDEASILAALELWEREIDASVPASRDLRRRVTTILLVGFFAGWAIPTVAMLVGSAPSWSTGTLLLSTILAVLLAPVGLVAARIARTSRRLQRGSTGMAVVLLVIPFVWLVGIAGTCVVTTAGPGL